MPCKSNPRTSHTPYTFRQAVAKGYYSGGQYTHISTGNSKIGKIVNVSTTMFAGCKKGVPCAKPNLCYAYKFYAGVYKSSCKPAWDGNLSMAKNYRNTFFKDIVTYLSGMRVLPKFFRWHVSGDFLDQNYLDNTIAIAKGFPTVHFLAFTKHHELDYSGAPSNYQIIFSMWPGWGSAAIHGRKAWVRDPKHPDSRIPSEVYLCPGSCANCRACWQLNRLGKDVMFDIH